MFGYAVNSEEMRLRSWKDRVDAIVKNAGITSKSSRPSITIMYDDTGGSISVQSMLKDDVASSLRKDVKTIGNDVFLLNCLGTFSIMPKDISLSCSIINEDGIPIDIVKSETIKNIDKKAMETREKILESFDDL